MSFSTTLATLLAKPAIELATTARRRKQIRAGFQAVVSQMGPSLEAACNDEEFVAGMYATAQGQVINLRRLVDHVTARPVLGQNIARRDLLEGLRDFSMAVINEWSRVANPLAGEMPYAFGALSDEARDLLDEELATTTATATEGVSLNPRPPRISKIEFLTEADVSRIAWGTPVDSNEAALAWFHAANSAALGHAIEYFHVWCPPVWVFRYPSRDAWGVRRLHIELVVDILNATEHPVLVDFTTAVNSAPFRFNWVLPARLTVAPMASAQANLPLEISPLHDVIPELWAGVLGARALAAAALESRLELPIQAHAGKHSLSTIVPFPAAVLNLSDVDVTEAEGYWNTIEQAWHVATAAEIEHAKAELRKYR